MSSFTSKDLASTPLILAGDLPKTITRDGTIAVGAGKAAKSYRARRITSPSATKFTKGTDGVTEVHGELHLHDAVEVTA